MIHGVVRVAVFSVLASLAQAAWADLNDFVCDGLLVNPPTYAVPIFGFEPQFGGYLKFPETTRQGCDVGGRSGALLSNNKSFVIGDELGDLRLPFLRVGLAPSVRPADADSVVARRPGIGIFNALFVQPVRTALAAAPRDPADFSCSF
jgi:hypothetical protein